MVYIAPRGVWLFRLDSAPVRYLPSGIWFNDWKREAMMMIVKM
jgi:hypothetical protein